MLQEWVWAPTTIHLICFTFFPLKYIQSTRSPPSKHGVYVCVRALGSWKKRTCTKKCIYVKIKSWTRRWKICSPSSRYIRLPWTALGSCSILTIQCTRFRSRYRRTRWLLPLLLLLLLLLIFFFFFFSFPSQRFNCVWAVSFWLRAFCPYTKAFANYIPFFGVRAHSVRLFICWRCIRLGSSPYMTIVKHARRRQQTEENENLKINIEFWDVSIISSIEFSTIQCVWNKNYEPRFEFTSFCLPKWRIWPRYVRISSK